jgi:hypothetical protein
MRRDDSMVRIAGLLVVAAAGGAGCAPQRAPAEPEVVIAVPDVEPAEPAPAPAPARPREREPVEGPVIRWFVAGGRFSGLALAGNDLWVATRAYPAEARSAAVYRFRMGAESPRGIDGGARGYHSLAVGDDRLYYFARDERASWMRSIQGERVTSVLRMELTIPEVDGASAIAVDGGTVYFTDGTATYRVEGDQPVRLASVGGCGLTIDERALYVRDGAGGDVWRIPRDGGAARSLAAEHVGPCAIETDGEEVYWANAIGSPVHPGEIVAAQVESGELLTLATSETSPSDLALDDQHLYWLTVTDEVVRVALGGGEPEVLFDGDNDSPGMIAVDAANVFWANDERLRYLPKPAP